MGRLPAARCRQGRRLAELPSGSFRTLRAGCDELTVGGGGGGVLAQSEQCLGPDRPHVVDRRGRGFRGMRGEKRVGTRQRVGRFARLEERQCRHRRGGAGGGRAGVPIGHGREGDNRLALAGGNGPQRIGSVELEGRDTRGVRGFRCAGGGDRLGSDIERGLGPLGIEFQ